MKNSHKEIKNKLTHFEYINCPLCGKSYKNTKTLFKNDHGLSDHKRICKKCGLIYQSPRRTEADNNRFYNEFYLSHYFDEYLDDGFGGAKRHFDCGYMKKHEFIMFHEDIKKAKKPIEIGCSSGGVLKALSEINPKIYGIDIDHNSIDYAKKQGMNADYKSIFDLESNTYDFVIMSHVCEHLLDSDSFLKKVNDILIEGGMFLIFVPDSYRTHEGPHVPHTFCFTEETLISMVTKHGFAVKRDIVYKDRPKYAKNDIMVLFKKDKNAKQQKSKYHAFRFTLLKFQRFLIRTLERTKTKQLVIKILGLDRLDHIWKGTDKYK